MNSHRNCAQQRACLTALPFGSLTTVQILKW